MKIYVLLTFFGGNSNVLLLRPGLVESLDIGFRLFYVGRRRSTVDSYLVLKNAMEEVCDDILLKQKASLVHLLKADKEFLKSKYFESDVRTHNVHSRIFRELGFNSINEDGLSAPVGYRKSPPNYAI